MPTRTRWIHHRNVRGACLVPGGRWLLLGGSEGTVTSYDLDAPTLRGRLLVKLEGGPHQQPIDHICVDIDELSPTLAFTMATTPEGHYSQFHYIFQLIDALCIEYTSAR
jgi:hypothetical protein